MAGRTAGLFEKIVWSLVSWNHRRDSRYLRFEHFDLRIAATVVGMGYEHHAGSRIGCLMLQKSSMPSEYEIWLDQVREALHSINMEMGDWQPVFAFDFQAAHDAGDTPDEAAMRANKFWWRRQNESLKAECLKTPGCWLPREHQGRCEPLYERGDYLKVEFPDEATGIGEWIWMVVNHADDANGLVYGTLDNEPVNDYGGKAKLGSQLAVSYENIRDHRKAADFRKVRSKS